MQHWDELINQVRDWAEERNITTGGGTPEGQAYKTFEEADELLAAVNRHDRDSAMDAVGDVLVTLIIQCEFWDFTLEDALEHAWEQIKDRTGRMENGVFVKDEDDGYMD